MNIKYSVLSSWTGEDLAAVDEQIRQANEVYLQYVAEYNSGMKNNSASYAKRVRLPRAEAAKVVVDNLKQLKKDMLSDMGQIQGIDLVDQTAAKAGKEPESEIPWSTIGMAVGALVVVVIIVKMI